MKLETEYIYELETELADLNENNLLKPQGYQKLFVQLGDMHLNNIDINVDSIIKYNLAWAFVSISIEIVKPVSGLVKLMGKTWHSHRRGPFFRREYLFTDSNGNILFKGCSFSVLLDMEKRTVYRKKDLPFYISPPINEFTIEAEANKKVDMDFIKVEDRKVYNSYIDCLGHVNNLKYSEFAYDTFTSYEIENLKNLNRMDIYFRSELRNGDILSIYKNKKNNIIFIRGDKGEKEDTSFDVVLSMGMTGRTPND